MKLAGYPAVAGLCATALFGAPATAAELDLSTLFAGYENGCDIWESPAARLVIWANPDDDGGIAPRSILPETWREHVGTPAVADNIDHWHVTVPLRSARFHGLPVVRFDRWRGKSNGISGWSLTVDASLDEARRHIDEGLFRAHEEWEFKPELSANGDGQAELVCDFSM